jgi:hypothetical protein
MPEHNMFILCVVIMGSHRKKICMDNGVLVQVSSVVMFVKRCDSAESGEEAMPSVRAAEPTNATNLIVEPT